jgi:hypothetical protein
VAVGQAASRGRDRWGFLSRAEAESSNPIFSSSESEMNSARYATGCIPQGTVFHYFTFHSQRGK